MKKKKNAFYNDSNYETFKFTPDWEKDFQFLNFIMQRKKNITKNYLINVTAMQKEKDTYVSDGDIEPLISKCVNETLDSIGGAYKTFIIEKYFGSVDNLISFITEDFYVDLTAYSINKNTEKIRKVVTEQTMRSITDLNKRK